ncbi:MAG: glycerate kinase, partial [Chloroflexi bacterium]|nr:glycerate kinase [Chloroflexota bacterium]
VAPMAKALEDLLGDRIDAGRLVVKDGHGLPLKKIRIHEAGHPLPDARGVAGTLQILNLLEGAGERDLVICLISGGGSALLSAPSEGIDLADKQAATKSLLACGATIHEINTIRKHLEGLKGGRLAALANGAQVLCLVLSDVVGNPLDMIASGPTVPDPSTYADALAILRRYNLLEGAAPVIRQVLARGAAGALPETLKPGDQVFARVHNQIIASNDLAAEAAAQVARGAGFNTLLLTTYLEGEAREVAKVLAALAKELVCRGQPLARPACLILGGETTVTLRGKGKGGRNQELALAAALALDGIEGVMLATLATDGGDGPTDAAGALIEGDTMARARALGLDGRAMLDENDSYYFFAALGDLMITGPTNTNVNDLALVCVW